VAQNSSRPVRNFLLSSSSAVLSYQLLFVRHVTDRLPLPSFTSLTLKQFRHILFKIWLRRCSLRRC